MAILNGTACRISIDGYTIIAAKSENFQSGMATRDTTTKSSGGNREIAEAIKSFSFDASGLWDLNTSSTSPQDIQDAWYARTPMAVTFMSGTTSGFRNMLGSAYVTDFSVKADLEGNTEWSAKFEGTGALTLTTQP